MGTEQEMRGGGAGEVSNDVESESFVRKRPAVVTKRLVPLTGSLGPQFCLLAADLNKNRS